MAFRHVSTAKNLGKANNLTKVNYSKTSVRLEKYGIFKK